VDTGQQRPCKRALVRARGGRLREQSQPIDGQAHPPLLLDLSPPFLQFLSQPKPQLGLKLLDLTARQADNRQHQLQGDFTSGAMRQPLPPRSTYELVKGSLRPMFSSAKQQPKSVITSQGQPAANDMGPAALASGSGVPGCLRRRVTWTPETAFRNNLQPPRNEHDHALFSCCSSVLFGETAVLGQQNSLLHFLFRASHCSPWSVCLAECPRNHSVEDA